MLLLTREVRFAINDSPEVQDRATNGFAGFPSLNGLGHYLALQVTLMGQPDPHSGYLQNIKHIDQAVRTKAIPIFDRAVRHRRFGCGALPLVQSMQALGDAWPGAKLQSLRLALSPFLSLEVIDQEMPMVRLSQMFEFSASHRLHNPSLSDVKNREVFGKCNNPHGHGHNYVLRVTLRGQPDANGLLIDIPLMERIVNERVIDRFDHRHLNIEVPEFADTNPSVENIAKVIYRLLQPAFADKQAELVSVTVWETPKTWAEYSEQD